MFFKSASGSDSPSGWIGCVGARAECAFADVPEMQRVSGPNFALAVFGSDFRTPTLRLDAQGNARAAIGEDTEAGCSATVAQDGMTVTLACDPFGLHGVFTAHIENTFQDTGRDTLDTAIGETFWFASDLALLRFLARLPSVIRADALHGYLCFSYVPTPTTLFAGIDALPAGSRLTFHAGSQKIVQQEFVQQEFIQQEFVQKAVEQRKIGQPEAGRLAATNAAPQRLWNESPAFLTDEAEAIRTLRQKLQMAVARQLGGAREVGVFLSGGLDSSLVAALLVEAGARVHLYTLDFGPPYDAELPAAREVAARLKQPLRVVSARVADVAQALRSTAQAMQQPFGDAVTAPLTLLGKAASSDVGMAFNGEFGDQLFGGWANKPMIAAELYGAQDYRREAAYLATFHRFYGLTDALYTPRLRQATADADVEARIRAELETGDFSGLLHRLRAANLRLKGAQNIGPRARQLAEACGLQVKFPFCDRELAEWTFTCPPEWFLQGACEKYLLKRAAEPYLPASIIWREKRGMGVPATDWCLGGLRRTIARILRPRRLEREGWFRPEAVRRLCRGSDHPGEIRTRRLGEKLWTLLMLHAWLDVHAGQTATVWKGQMGRSEGNNR